MKKEGIDELKKIFEKNIKEAGKEKNKQNIKDEKEKSGSFHDKNKQNETIKEKNIINKSVYLSSSNINKLKDTFNKEINNKVKENELETIKKKLNSIIKKTEIKTEKKKEEKTNVDKKEIKPKEKKEEIKKLEKNDIKNEEIKKKEKISNEIKKMDAPDIKLIHQHYLNQKLIMKIKRKKKIVILILNIKLQCLIISSKKIKEKKVKLNIFIIAQKHIILKILLKI